MRKYEKINMVERKAGRKNQRKKRRRKGEKDYMRERVQDVELGVKVV